VIHYTDEITYLQTVLSIIPTTNKTNFLTGWTVIRHLLGDWQTCGMLDDCRRIGDGCTMFFIWWDICPGIEEFSPAECLEKSWVVGCSLTVGATVVHHVLQLQKSLFSVFHFLLLWSAPPCFLFISKLPSIDFNGAKTLSLSHLSKDEAVVCSGLLEMMHLSAALVLLGLLVLKSTAN